MTQGRKDVDTAVALSAGAVDRERLFSGDELKNSFLEAMSKCHYGFRRKK